MDRTARVARIRAAAERVEDATNWPQGDRARQLSLWAATGKKPSAVDLYAVRSHAKRNYDDAKFRELLRADFEAAGFKPE